MVIELTFASEAIPEVLMIVCNTKTCRSSDEAGMMLS